MKALLTRILIIGLCLYAVPVSAEPVEEHRAMQPEGRLTLDAQGGHYRIVGHDADQLTVRGRLGADAESVDISGDDNAWKIRVRPAANNATDTDATSELTIRIPAGTSLEVTTIEGRLELDGLSPDLVRIETVSADVRGQRLAANRVHIESISGRLGIADSRAEEVRVRSLSGDIELRQVQGRIHARSVAGNIDLEQIDLAALDAEVVSGRVQARINPRPGALIRARSHTGALDLVLPMQTGLDLHASSHSGDINSEFGGQMESRNGLNRRLRHRNGDGAVRAELASFSGPIFVAGASARAARVLVYRERIPAYNADLARFGVDDEILVDLAANQYALMQLPADASELMVAAHDSAAHRLTVEAWGSALNCFRVVPERSNWSVMRLSDVPGQARRQLPIFQLEAVDCPAAEFFDDMDQVE